MLKEYDDSLEPLLDVNLETFYLCMLGIYTNKYSPQ